MAVVMSARPPTLRDLLDRHERLIIVQTLQRNNYSRERTAAILGLSEATLWRRMRRHGIGGDEAPVVRLLERE